MQINNLKPFNHTNVFLSKKSRPKRKGLSQDFLQEFNLNNKLNSTLNTDLIQLVGSKKDKIYDDTDIRIGFTEWITIPSKSEDSANFKKNLKILKSYRFHSDCLKKDDKKDLKKYSIRIYLDKGVPKLKLKLENNVIREIQTNKDDNSFPVRYLNPLRNFMRENNLKISRDVYARVKKAENIEQEILKVQEKIKPRTFVDLSIPELLRFFNFKVERDGKRKLIIDEYHQPSESFTFDDIGIDEDIIFARVSEIKGDADFRNSNVKNLGILKRTGGKITIEYTGAKKSGNLKNKKGDISFGHSQYEKEKYKNIFEKKLNKSIQKASVKEILEAAGIKTEEGSGHMLTIDCYKQPFDEFSFSDLGIDENKLFKKIKEISSGVSFRNSAVTDLGNLEKISRDADFSRSFVENLGKLKEIGGDADFSLSKIKTLGNLKNIDGGAYFEFSNIEDLGKLENIRKNAVFSNSKVKTLGNLKYIGKDADFRYSNVENLENLENILGDANFSYSQIKNLGKLKNILGNADFKYSGVENLGKLKNILEDANFSYSKIKDLGNLENIGRNACFSNSLVENLGKLKNIGNNANFSNSLIKDLNKLTNIGGSANFSNSFVKNLGKLTDIGGSADFEDSNIKNLGVLKNIAGNAYIVHSLLTPDMLKNINIGGEIYQEENL